MTDETRSASSRERAKSVQNTLTRAVQQYLEPLLEDKTDPPAQTRALRRRLEKMQKARLRRERVKTKREPQEKTAESDATDCAWSDRGGRARRGGQNRSVVVCPACRLSPTQWPFCGITGDPHTGQHKEEEEEEQQHKQKQKQQGMQKEILQVAF